MTEPSWPTWLRPGGTRLVRVGSVVEVCNGRIALRQFDPRTPEGRGEWALRSTPASSSVLATQAVSRVSCQL
ncbi:MAG: hypothetical protein ACRCYR_02865 [Phycicoccus sp.]